MTAITQNLTQFPQKAWRGFQEHAKRAKWTVENAEALGYAAKAVTSGLDIALTILKEVSGPARLIHGFGAIAGQLNGFNKFFSSIKVIQRANEWVDPAIRKRTISDGWQTVAAKVALTAGQTLDTIKYLDSVNLIDLGRVATHSVGNVPVFNLVKDGFFVVACSLGLITDTKKLLALRERKIAWKAVIENKTEQELQDYYRQKVNQAYGDAAKSAKLSERINHIEIVKEYKEDKFKHESKKNWISLAANVSKIAIICLGIGALALGVSSIVSVGIVLSAVSLAVSAIGLGKKLFTEFNRFSTFDDRVKTQ